MIADFICLVFGLLIFLIGRNFMSKKKNLPPGPVKWPFIGNIIELLLGGYSKYPHFAMRKMSDKYGEVMRISIGVQDFVVISSYKAMKEILTKAEIMGRYEFPWVTDRAFGQRLGLVWGHGDMWQEVRRFTVKGLKTFGYGKPAKMDGIYAEEVPEFITHIKELAKENKGILHVDSRMISASVVGILWDIVAGYKFPKGDESIYKFMTLNEKQMDICGHNNIYIAFPILRHLFPKWTLWTKHQQVHKEIQQNVKEIVEDIKKQRASRNEQEAENLVEYLIDETNRNIGNPSTYFTEEQTITVLMDLFLGGSETTSTMIIWIILFVTLYPEVQRKIQKEISQTLGESGASISVRDAERMVYTKAVILEVFRRCNMGPMPPIREALKDFHYNEYVIPKGYGVMYNYVPVFLDEEFWGDPLVFRPERFLNHAGTELVTSKSDVVSTQFGFGKRICPGEDLAMDSLFVYTTSLLKALSFQVIPGMEPSIENPHYGLTVCPLPYSVKVVERN